MLNCAVRRMTSRASSTGFSSSPGAAEDVYVAADSFYDSQANLHRRYFYTIDLRGQLFLSSSKYKNFATALKDTKFLWTTYLNLEVNTTNIFIDKYKYISRCGREVNYIHHSDDVACLGFSRLSTTSEELIYAGGLAQPFEPGSLAFSQASGRIYHPIIAHRKLGSHLGHWGLLHPSLIAELSRNITLTDGGARARLEWQGKVYDINNMHRE